MKIYQDLIAVGQSEKERGKFCRDAINEFRSSAEYRIAAAGEAYYAKHNLTIERYQKFLYTLGGAMKPDLFSANFKLKTGFFRRLVTQQVQYVLGNGVSMTKNPENKSKLGRTFDNKLQEAAKRAMASGKAFGFWNYDHMEVFGYVDTPQSAGFCPLYDAETAELMAGIRYWFRKVGKSYMMRCTLYEVDGYTEYVQKSAKSDVEVLEPKRGYIRETITTAAGGVESVTDENYTKLPIVVLYANDTHESELVGIRECIDCYDFIKSGLANAIDDWAGFFWIIENAGGMDDPDLAQFIQRMKTVHAASLEDGTKAEAHTMEVPHEARRVMLEILRNDIYEDFQALDVKTLSAAAKTTQEIQSAYQAQDNKCADFEYNLIEFVEGIMALAGIDDEVTFKWQKVVNMAEQTSVVLQAANYLPPEIIINHLPMLTPEEAEYAIANYNAQGMAQFMEPEEEI